MTDKVYIEKGALLDEFHSLCGPQTGDGWDNWGVQALIERQKPVSVEQVQHCGDGCHYYRKDPELAEAAYLDPDSYCSILQCEMPENGFCYWGKVWRDNHLEDKQNG